MRKGVNMMKRVGVSIVLAALALVAVGGCIGCKCCSDAIPEMGPDENGFVSIFNGKDLSGWEGATSVYGVDPREKGVLQCIPGTTKFPDGRRANLVTVKEYGDFILRFEFKMTKNGNNGLGIRITDIYKDAAYYAMCELQLLDDGGEAYYDAKTRKDKLKPHQYTGSVYGVFPSRRDNAAEDFSGGGSYVRKPGEWNQAEVRVVGSAIEVLLNGQLVTKGDVAKFKGNGDTPDEKPHPGLHNQKGRIGWLGHGDNVKWRNIRIKEL